MNSSSSFMGSMPPPMAATRAKVDEPIVTASMERAPDSFS